MVSTLIVTALWSAVPLLNCSGSYVSIQASESRSNVSESTLVALKRFIVTNSQDENSFVLKSQTSQFIGQDLLHCMKFTLSRDGKVGQQLDQKVTIKSSKFQFSSGGFKLRGDVMVSTDLYVGEAKSDQILNGIYVGIYDVQSQTVDSYSIAMVDFLGVRVYYPAVEGKSTQIPLGAIQCNTVLIDGPQKRLAFEGLRNSTVSLMVLTYFGLRPTVTGKNIHIRSGTEKNSVNGELTSAFGLTSDQILEEDLNLLHKFDLRQPLGIAGTDKSYIFNDGVIRFLKKE